MSGYREDLAFIHDTGFGSFSRDAAPFVLQQLSYRGHRGGLVIDIGCGSGILAEKLHLAGYEVLGMDLSASMLRIARQRVPSARFQRRSYLDASFPPCVGITALGEVLTYRFDGRNDSRRLLALFRRMYAALVPGGILIFDISEPGRGMAYVNRYWKGRDWALLVEVHEDTSSSRLIRDITTFRKIGKRYRRNQETHVLNLYRAADIATQLRSAGFLVRIHRSYGGRKLLPYMAAFVAWKP